MQVTIHVGMPKVATTTLQREVFPSFRGINLVILNSTPEEFVDSDGELLISCEQIGGKPWSKEVYGGPLYPTDWLKTFKKRIQRLHRLFPEAGIILGVRNHADLILSLYSQYLKEGGTLRMVDSFSFEKESFITPGDLLFVDRIKAVTGTFDRFFLYTLEDLRYRPKELYAEMLAFSGGSSFEGVDAAKSNPGFQTMLQAEVARSLNRINHWLMDQSLPTLRNSVFQALDLTPRSIATHKLAGVASTPLELSNELAARIHEFYADDWAAVEHYSEKYGVL